MRRQGSTTQAERIVALDVLRGFALLGILVMNIQSFGMTYAAYGNPMVGVNPNNLNLTLWSVIHVFADTKFMTLFSLLFGAGVLLFTERAEAKGQRVRALHYRRTLYLLAFGLLHTALWSGDVLTIYSIGAMLVFWARKWPVKRLLLVGLFCLSLPSLFFLLADVTRSYWPEEELRSQLESIYPSDEDIAEEIEAFRSNIAGIWAYRNYGGSVFVDGLFLVVFYVWRPIGLMLWGMALFKLGVLSLKRDEGFYRKMIVYGFAIGIPLILVGLWYNFSLGFQSLNVKYRGIQWNYWGGIGVAMAYIGVIMLMLKQQRFPVISSYLASYGQMALSNYLGQTILATTFFYGYGLGQFARYGMFGLCIITIGIWTLQLFVSKFWMRRFRYGPFEWLWRCLTYGNLQPILRRP